MKVDAAYFKAEYPKEWPSAQPTAIDKIKTWAWNFFSVLVFPVGLCRLSAFLLRKLCSRLIIPGPSVPENQLAGMRQNILAAFNGKEVSLLSPDEVRLRGALFRGPISNKAIVYVPGNAEQIETSQRSLNLLKTLGVTVMMVNPRTAKGSPQRMSATPKELALDVYTAFETLIHKEKIDPENILLYGRSLGGGYGNLAASLIQQKYADKKIKACNERSFTDLAIEVRYFLGRVLGTIASLFIKAIGWQIDSKKAWDSLKGKKCVIYHKLDGIIPHNASLYKAIKNTNKAETYRIKMNYYQDDKEWTGVSPFFHNKAFDPFEEETVLKTLSEMLEIPAPSYLSSPEWHDDEHLKFLKRRFPNIRKKIKIAAV